MSETDPVFKPTMRPATRTALIISGFFLFGITWTSYWVSREALRIKRQRDATAAAGNSLSGQMVWIPGGKFTMGAIDGQPDEQPLHDVKVSGFWMDRTEVTNEQFEAFVRATKYVTVAERVPTSTAAAERPPGAFVFTPKAVASLADTSQWWTFTAGANWRQPEGPNSSIVGREKHPVVQVCWEDATAYAAWAGKRLPTEAEWECAARGGLNHQPFIWGREKLPGGKWMANIWQGKFPVENTTEDGFVGTAPVAGFPANGFGLFDMAGNVWEWCADWYRSDYYANSMRQDPQGPASGEDPKQPGVTERVARGGSFMCTEMYCAGYRPSARMKFTPTSALANTGFRCVRNGPAPR